jgi:hypothetical protein
MWESYVEEGKTLEQRFALLLDNPVFASKEQDTKDHWDVKGGDGKTYDVKGMKKYRRKDKIPTDRIHFVELKNVHGNKGWLYGKADYFAFETRKWWIVVGRSVLAGFVKDNVPNTKERVHRPEPYKLYSREGRNDLMTILPTVDLLSIASQVLVKK